MHLPGSSCQSNLAGVRYSEFELIFDFLILCVSIPVPAESGSHTRTEHVSDWSGCGQSAVHAGSVPIPV